MALFTIDIDDCGMSDIEILSDYFGVSVSEVAQIIMNHGSNMLFDIIGSSLSKERKERTKEKKENIYIYNTFLEKGGMGGKTSLLNKPERKKRKKRIPKDWVENSDSGLIAPSRSGGDKILEYSERHGYNHSDMVRMFQDFVNYHMKNGSVFSDWVRAWYTWVRNDIKFNGGPAKKTGNVIRSYQKL